MSTKQVSAYGALPQAGIDRAFGAPKHDFKAVKRQRRALYQPRAKP